MVTGASSGLGEEFARQLAAEGFNLYLLARRRERLEALGEELTELNGVECRSLAIDLNAAEFLQDVSEQTAGTEIGLLVNNAGFTNYGKFLENDLAAEENLVNVNCRAITSLAHHFGGLMRDRGRGAMIVTSSIVGFTSVPVWGAYAASKSYDLLLAEALAVEWKPHDIDVLELCPGATRTEFAAYQVLSARLFAMDTKAVVSGALKNIGRRTVYIPGFLNRMNVLTTRFLPRRLSARIFSVLIRDMVHESQSCHNVGWRAVRCW